MDELIFFWLIKCHILVNFSSIQKYPVLLVSRYRMDRNHLDIVNMWHPQYPSIQVSMISMVSMISKYIHDIQEYPLSHLYLQETKLDLLTPDECSYFEKMLAPNRTNEICTGRKNSFPKHWKFKRLLSKTKKKYHFKLIGPSTNYLGFKKTKYNYYLGGTDSCQGT